MAAPALREQGEGEPEGTKGTGMKYDLKQSSRIKNQNVSVQWQTQMTT